MASGMNVQLLEHYLRQWIDGPGDGNLLHARTLAGAGALDALIVPLSGVAPVSVLSDSEINPACVYELDLPNVEDRAVVYVSTILPIACVEMWRAQTFMGFCMGDVERSPVADACRILRQAGLVLLDESTCRAPSPFVRDGGPEFMTYYEMLFEFDVDPPWLSSR